MMPSPRPRSTRQALAGLQYALGTVAPANPLVFAWRWRYELILGIGLPAALAVLAGVSDDHAPCQGVLPGGEGFGGPFGPMT